jgi:hypothetical protein
MALQAPMAVRQTDELLSRPSPRLAPRRKSPNIRAYLSPLLLLRMMMASNPNGTLHSSQSPVKSNPNAHSHRKLRSQYPRGDTENHVEYILVASFDIDRGPVMEHQYPVAITGDEHMLAELMLPDQAHVRNQDWTIFFLHKDTSQEEEEAELKAEKRRRKKRRRDIAEGLVEADEEDEADLENHPSDDDSDSSEESEDEGGEGPPLIYVLNLVNTKQDKTAKRGAVVKAMAICTRHPFLHIYKVGICHDSYCPAANCLAPFIISIGGVL